MSIVRSVYGLLLSMALGLLLYECGGGPRPPVTNAEKLPSWWNALPTDIAVTPLSHDTKKLCATFRTALPADYQQDFVTVPEEWGNPASPKIQVFYYWNHEAAKTATPIVFYNGGPTHPSHSTYEAMKERIAKEKAPFVFIDQRGTGCSTPYPTEISETTAKRLGNYGSVAIIKDSEVIREKLLGKNGKWKVYGQSAGGWMVQRYIDLAPRNLQAAYAHGAAFSQNAVQEFAFRIASQKRIAELYFRKYPGDRRIIAEARQRIAPTLCFNDGSTRLCGPGILDALIMPLGFQSGWANVHDWIVIVDGTDDAYFQTWVKELAQNFFFQTYISPNGFAASVVGLVEAVQTGNEEICVAAQKLLEKQGIKPEEMPFNECRLTMAMEQKWNDVVGVVTRREPYHIENVRRRLEEFPALKFYLYSGALDPLVPTESFADTLAELKGRVQFHEFRDSGHEGFFTEDKVWNDLRLN